MKKIAKVFLIISIIVSLIAVADVVTNVFSTKLNKYYKVD